MREETRYFLKSPLEATPGYETQGVYIAFEYLHYTDPNAVQWVWRELRPDQQEGYAYHTASRHTEGKAIDMQISWTGILKLKWKDGTTTSIASTPRDSTNDHLIEVGKSYDVVHFQDVQKDKVHWSTDGR